MRATMLTSVRGIELRQVDDPAIHFGTDAIVTVTASCICGSDLHGYRGHATTVFPRRIGHEFIGVVSETGSEVTTVAACPRYPCRSDPHTQLAVTVTVASVGK